MKLQGKEKVFSISTCSPPICSKNRGNDRDDSRLVRHTSEKRESPPRARPDTQARSPLTG